MGGMLREISNRVACLNAEKAPLELTFGVEAEFCLLGYVSTHPWIGDPNFSAKMMVYHALTDTPACGICATCGQAHSFTLPVASPETRDHSFSETEWTITQDVSVQPVPSDTGAYIRSLEERGEEMLADHHRGMELRSCPLQVGKNVPTSDSTTDPYHRHEITIEQQIKLVFEKLHDAFNTIEGTRGTKREKNRIAVNTNCGLHVHVGNGIKSRGFPLSTIKNVQKLYTANERSIDMIQSTDRVTGTSYAARPLAETTGRRDRMIPGPKAYNNPNSHFFINSAFGLLHHTYEGSSDNPLEHVYPFSHLDQPVIANAASGLGLSDFLTLIENASSIADLRYLNLGGEHSNTLNLANLQYFNPAGYRSGKVTFEFRQHGGTLEAADFLPWVDFVTKMVQFAHDSTPAAMRAHLDKVLTDPGYDMMNLLKDLHCETSTIHHYSFVIGRTSNGENYAQARLAKQTAEIDEIPAAHDVFNRMRHAMAKTQAASLLPAAIQGRVDMKFRLGGYGRFSEAYLDAYMPPLSDAEKFWLGDGNALTQATGVTNQIMPTYASGADPMTAASSPSWGDPEDLALTPPRSRAVPLPSIYRDPIGFLNAMQPNPGRISETRCQVQQPVPPPEINALPELTSSPSPQDPPTWNAPDDLYQLHAPPATPRIDGMPPQPTRPPSPLDLPPASMPSPATFPPSRPTIMSRRSRVVADVDVSAARSYRAAQMGDYEAVGGETSRSL